MNNPHRPLDAASDVVLFDMFGVIARHQSEAGKERLAALAGGPAPAFWDAYWGLRQPYDRGDVNGVAYWKRVADALGTAFEEARVARLIEADLASWSAVDDTMVTLVEELTAAGQPVALLSNIPEELAAHYEERHSWLKHFQVCAFSCRIGHAKPEPGAYRWCLEALGAEPGRVLFVDDREENIRAAEAVGVRGHLFTTPARLREVLRLSA
ncbi:MULTISPECIES: HAD family phosphatase [unclassified Streptomyces]|uniref:HAD family hydrolase n=1 Tax=unclassified Streptomyces TaxID=2593676 RepID=UPI0013707156|nr:MULTISPECIES: HAD family phosphatase [unclassified Streptomyces]NEA01017.1 HAD family phosphatase [Streptomyces sp. SID10116]MYY87642.1 HAD-IA family hydrolase [Streptomyces sp. SID335]MYZ12933.1 HAD-IA family hydrolase [Streptomyces sp. SID337]NDZ87229.1 HAD family phosphatase [Streptomyces sp. SID10115]NEB49460.1 HAD family phosphatase [Streptomyces sp. SID339]